MTRRKFRREFKIAPVQLVTERAVAVAQACRFLELAQSVLRRWMREAAATLTTAFLDLHQLELQARQLPIGLAAIIHERAFWRVVVCWRLFHFQERTAGLRPDFVSGVIGDRVLCGLGFVVVDGLRCSASCRMWWGKRVEQEPDKALARA